MQTHRANLPTAHRPRLTQSGGSSSLPTARRLSLVPLQVDSKATLGLGGVVVVLGAVMASMGFFAYLGVPSSLVILQVVPFLVLAVGADNIFIFVLEYQVRAQAVCVPPTAPPCPGAALQGLLGVLQPLPTHLRPRVQFQ